MAGFDVALVCSCVSQLSEGIFQRHVTHVT